MFQRRTPLSILQKMREIVWPSMGWRRTYRYAQLRLIRIGDSTGAIARGLAFGMSISFTPLPGTHIISAIGLTMATRGNVLAAVAGTVIGNPWTFPLMWWMAYKLGDFSFRLFGATPIEMPKNFTWDDFLNAIVQHPMDLVVPWVCGGFILMGLSWPIFYIVSYRMVKKLRHKHGRGIK